MSFCPQDDDGPLELSNYTFGMQAISVLSSSLTRRDSSMSQSVNSVTSGMIERHWLRFFAWNWKLADIRL